MKTNVLKSKYRILVVTDQSRPSDNALQNAINLAKTVDGAIELFYVKPPTQVVRNVNQLSAMRELNTESNRTRRKLRTLVDQISEAEGIPIIYDFAFGNVIYEVQEHINKTQPDIVVLAKSKTKVANLLGTDLASYLLKNYKGTLLISAEEKTLRVQNGINLGILDDFSAEDTSNLTQDLEKNGAKQITFFKIKTSGNGARDERHASEVREAATRTRQTTFEFDQGANFSTSVTKYVQKSGVNLLCVRKSSLLDLNKGLKAVTRQIQKTIQKTDVPVLILES